MGDFLSPSTNTLTSDIYKLGNNDISDIIMCQLQEPGRRKSDNVPLNLSLSQMISVGGNLDKG